MTNKVPPVVHVFIRPVAAPPQPPLPQIFSNLVPARTKQRPGKTNPIGKPPNRPNPSKPPNPGSPRKPLQNRLRVVILLVTRCDPLAIVRLGNINQSPQPHTPTRSLNRHLRSLGQAAHVALPRHRSNPELFGLVQDKSLVRIRLRPSKLMINMRT